MEKPSGAVTITQFKKDSSRTLSRLNVECAPIALMRNGKSVAVLVDLDTYAELVRWADFGVQAGLPQR